MADTLDIQDWKKRVATARRKGIHEAFDCCRQIIRSFGGDNLTPELRESLIAMVDHMEGTAK